MAKRLTPIERAIAGEPSDRRRRYDAKMREEGFTRITLMVRPQDVDRVKRLAKSMRAEHRGLKPDPETRPEAPQEGTERPQRSEDAPRPLRASKARS
jgi:hypothetical protein